MIRLVTLLTIIAVALGRATALRAQQFSLRLGGMSALYSDSITGNAGALGARMTWTGGRTRGIAEANYVAFTTGDAAGQLWTDMVVIGPSSAQAAAGLRFSGVATTTSGSTATAIGSMELFGARAIRAWTLTAAVSAGGVRSVAADVRATGAASLRARVDLPRNVSMMAAVTGTVAGAIRYADATLSADWRRGAFAIGALAGARTGDLKYRPWAQAWGSWSLTACMALEAQAGTYPRDLTGFDFGRYVNMGLRIQVGPRAFRNDAAIAASMLASSAARSADSASDVVVATLDSASVLATFLVPDVLTLDIMGDWNDWKPEPMRPDGAGHWEATVPRGQPTRRFMLLGDGTRTIIPVGVTRLPDDFGGEAGLLVVP
jgi:hypothetical protein